MAIIRSIFAGVSGLRNHQTFMDIIGNNIANVNTHGFKSGRITFKEVFALQLRGAIRPSDNIGGVNPLQLGLGTDIGSIDTIFSQGTLESTGQVTDLAIQGDGFFIVSDRLQQYYTRAGAFQFDATGSLVNPNNGTRVQGQLANSSGIIPTGAPIGDIILPFGQKSPAKATTEIKFTGNLDAGARPKGTILETKGVFATELSGQNVNGGDTNVQNLLARSTATTPVVTRMDGITPNSTTITVIDGIDRNEDNVVNEEDGFNFTYVATDTPSNYDFNSLQDMVTGINAVFGAGGDASTDSRGNTLYTTDSLTASFTDGQIHFTLNTAINATSTRKSGLTILSSNGNLQRALSSGNIAYADRSDTTKGYTDIFSHIAQRVDLLTNLTNDQGEEIGLQATDVINIAGKKGGVDVPAPTTPFTVSTKTYGDFLDTVKSVFDIAPEEVGTGVEIKDTNGAMLIKGNGGVENELSSVNITVTDNDNFNAIFDSRPNNYSTVQAAADVTASATATIFDSLGQKQVMTITFTKDAKVLNKWTFGIGVQEPAEIGGGSTGTIYFNNDGSLARFEHTGATQFVTFDPKTGAVVPASIRIDAGTRNAFDGITQLGTSSSVVASDQDGYGLGELDSITIDRQGRINGAFTNGVNQLLGQLALATFNNPAGLKRSGDNSFVQTANSGTPIVGKAGTNIPGTSISTGALEQSNVELAKEFTDMIIAQRGFQANARVVTVSDAILTEIVDLKR